MNIQLIKPCNSRKVRLFYALNQVINTLEHYEEQGEVHSYATLYQLKKVGERIAMAIFKAKLPYPIRKDGLAVAKTIKKPRSISQMRLALQEFNRKLEQSFI